MMIDDINVPDMPWINEYNYSSRVAAKQYAGNGALLVEESSAREAFCLSLIAGCADALWFGCPGGGLANPGAASRFMSRCSHLRVVWRGSVLRLR